MVKLKLKYLLQFILPLLIGCIFTNIALGATYSDKSPTASIKYQNGWLFNYGPDLFTMKFKGYVQGDAMKFAPGNDLLNSGTNLRRARLALLGKILRNWTYVISYSLSESKLKNANIGYIGWRNMYLIIGQFSPDFSLANWTSNTATNFLELGLPIYAFSPPYSQGIKYGIYNDFIAFKTSVFSGSTTRSYVGTNPIGGTARFIFSPIHTKTRVLHLGISDWMQKPDGSDSVNFGSIPEARSHSADELITATINNVKYYNAIDLEAAGVYGPWSAQAEYTTNQVMRKNAQPNLRFSGYYLTASYFITGESRAYKFPGGGFLSIPPIHNKKYGAWQILARLSGLNLNDDAILGGKETNTTFGLNWYVNSFIAFKFNFIHARARPAYNGKNYTTNIYAVRMQLKF